MNERCTIHFEGRVQGVGFRVTARHVASSFTGLSGWVRNEADGSVMMVVEGEGADIQECLDELRQRMGRNIVRERVEWDDAAGGFEGFEIRY